jgi:hypothetical protein
LNQRDTKLLTLAANVAKAKWRILIVFASFEDWTGGRSVACWGTNSGSQILPFQT